MTDTCGIWEKFDPENNLVKEYKHWILVIRKNHATLGCCVAITKEHHELLGDLSAEEMAEYQMVAYEVESALKKSFDYDVIYHMLTMKKDKHTHFHIFPKYKTSRDFAGICWQDDYDEIPLGMKCNQEQNILDQIRDEIKRNIQL